MLALKIVFKMSYFEVVFMQHFFFFINHAASSMISINDSLNSFCLEEELEESL